LLNPLFKTSARADSQRWRSHRRRLQNSFGPLRSRLASQVNNVATAIISAIPATLTDACMTKLFEIRCRITNPTNDSNTLRQYIANEFSPQRIIDISKRLSRPSQSGRVSMETTIARDR